MKVLLSWVREFVDIDEPAEAIGRKLSLRGLPLEALEPMSDDALMDFEVTANRPDCMSVAGIAREIAVVYGLPFRAPHSAWPEAGASPSPAAAPPIRISIEAPDLCARYVGAVADVTIGPSPAWMADRLNACGVRPISNVVDITNYVLLELGQPMHAFDHARLAGPAIVVRRARAGETLRTLDGKPRALAADMLVIADAERASAIGGVMGGAESEVSASTRRIVFESAWFKPQSVRATSRALGLRTEASMRFERGADLTAPAVAMARACELLSQLGAGTAGPLLDVYPARHQPAVLFLAQPRVEGLLGMHVPDAEIVRILEALGFGVEPVPGGWSVVAPGWRVDMHRDVDLIEEIGRHHGFEHLPATFPGVQQAPAPSDPRIARDARARRVALAAGFSEAISFAFIEARHAEPFQGGEAPVALANPLSEKFAVMRPSLVPGLVGAVSHNRRHGRRDVQLFEIGTRFSARGETRAIGLAWTGLATPDHWSGGRRDVDFFDMKGVVEQLASLFDVEISARAPAEGSVAEAVLVPGRAAVLVSGDRSIGWLGQLQAAIGDAHDLPANDVVYVAECDLDALSAAVAPARMTTPLPRFPAAVRDIAMLVDESLSAATVRGTIRSKAPSTLVGVTEFDRYQGKGIPDGKVSLALRLTFQSLERTLTDSEVEAATTAVVDLLTSELGAVRR
ncbi:MAG: phenylalanine--tRNA ligase subunit beta [Acidobacteria bacterium]|nr:phenylalanine--tRNA ligase subunit beta [Acidobacteriota bacterium]